MKQTRTYIAPHEVYTGGMLYRPGQPFTTDEPRGTAWQPVGPPEKDRIADRAEAAR